MQIFRYAYPCYPGQYDGTNWQTELGIFDFVLEEALELLRRKLREQEPELYISAVRRAACQITLQNIEWLETAAATGEQAVVWNHALRQMTADELGRQHQIWSAAMLKLNRSNLQKPIVLPDNFEDLFLGNALEELIYAKRFICCRCRWCCSSYSSQECLIEQWTDFGAGGERLACLAEHTLHAHETIEFLPRM